MAATEEQRIAVVTGKAKKAMATRVRRSRKAPKAAGARAEWNEDIPRISLIQIFEIKISLGCTAWMGSLGFQDGQPGIIPQP